MDGRTSSLGTTFYMCQPIRNATKRLDKRLITKCMGHSVPALLYSVLSYQECLTKMNSTVFSIMIVVPVRIADNFTFVTHHTV